MRNEYFNKIDESKYKNLLFPTKPKGIAINAVILGFDVEYTKDRLLSVQFAGHKNNRIVSECYIVTEDKISIKQLEKYVLDFVQKYDIEKSPHNIQSSFKPTYHLIAHFAQAEISQIKDWSSALKIEPKGKDALFASQKKGQIRIVDLATFFEQSLEEIAKYTGCQKQSLKSVGGKSEKYWKSHMDQFLEKYLPEFKKYTARNAEIILKAFAEMRNDLIEEFKIDPLIYKTTGSVAMAIFRTRFLQECSEPNMRKYVEPNYRNNPNGSRDEEIVRKRVFLDHFDQGKSRRELAIRCIWGGRCEAYVYGRLREEFILYDVNSLYPHAAILQPLPNLYTSWEDLGEKFGKALKHRETDEILDEILNSYEGFVHAYFIFPKDTKYPCLPLAEAPNFIFPLKGWSYCTIAELRAAKKLNVERIHIGQGFGFKPTKLDERPAEINHDLGRYMKYFLKRKKAADEGTIKYQLHKELVNKITGKLIAKNEGVEKVSVGESWAPEWNALMVGKARALMSDFINLGALFCATDSVLLPSNVDIKDCQAYKDLKSVGSDLREKCRATDIFIIKSDLYLLNGSSEFKVAGHGYSGTKKEFRRKIRRRLSEGSGSLSIKGEKKGKVTYKEAEDGKGELNADIIRPPRETDLEHKGKKRKLVNKDINIYTEYTETKPIVTITKEHRPVGRPRKLTEEQENKIDEMIKQGKKRREIMDEFDISEGPYKRILKRLSERSNK